MKEGIFKLIKDILFPCFCVDCGQEGEWWCARCLAKLEIELIKQCPVCSRATLAGEVCRNCRIIFHLDGVTALFSYQEGSGLAKLIKQFKYSYARDITVVWQKILAKQPNFLPSSFFSSNLTIIPVPLHSRRQRQRGFNQSTIIARAVQQLIGLERETGGLETGLWRTRYTKQQALLSGEQRRQNLAGAFAWSSRSAVPEEVLLVDDVFTTGSTLQECAKVLKANGSRKVWGLVLARG